MSAFITDFSILPKALSLHTPFNISLSEHRVANNVFIRLQGGDGQVGIGEAAPFPILTGDDHRDVFKVLRGVLPNLCRASSFVEAKAILAKCRQERLESPTALAALEMAIIDLDARNQGKSLGDYFAAKAASTIETDITIPILAREDLEPFLKFVEKIGFRKFKFKVGSKDLEDDLYRIKRVVETCGQGIIFTVDGNQNMTIATSLELLNRLSQLNLTPEFFEQPLPQDQWREFIELTAESPIPICADELVKTAADAQRVVDEGAANMINLKNTKSGPFGTLEIIAIAGRHQIPLMIGGMIESEVAMTFSLHMACAFPEIEYFDLDTPFFFDSPVTSENPFQHGTPFLTRPMGNGLGLELK